MRPDQIIIIARTAVVFGVESAAITSRSRIAAVVSARQAAAWAMRQAGQSYPAIGAALGYADHSTAVSAVEAARRRAESSPAYAAQLEQLESMLQLREWKTPTVEQIDKSDPRVAEFLKECGL